MERIPCVLAACPLNMFRGHDQGRDGRGGGGGEEEGGEGGERRGGEENEQVMQTFNTICWMAFGVSIHTIIYLYIYYYIYI